MKTALFTYIWRGRGCMLNYVWGFLILFSVIISFFTGRTDAVMQAAMEGAGQGVMLVFDMLGMMCFWTGLMEIAQSAGIIKGISRLFRPITHLLFPAVPQKSRAMDAIVMNMSANLLGMGNAATPLGLRAMQELDTLNHGMKRASNEMCMFVLVNTASLQLLPTTLFLLRQKTGSEAPAEILIPIWLVSFAALFIGILSAKIFQKRN